MKITLVVATDEAGLIGNQGDLPWRLPGDLRRFRKITMGHPIVMGRTTFDSIGRALPGRTNIVLTRREDFTAPDVLVAHSLEDALALGSAAEGGEEMMIIGGAQIYEQMLPRATHLCRTLVHHRFEGDCWFPTPDPQQWSLERERHFPADEKNAYACTLQWWAKR